MSTNRERSPAILRPDGQCRQKPTILPDKFKGILDYAPNCGWHNCNDRYFIRRLQKADLVNSYLLILTADGEGMASVGGETHHLTRNTAVLFPKAVFHSYWVPKGRHWEFYWIHMTGPHCDALLEYVCREHGCFFDISCRETLAELIELLLDTPYRYYEYEFFAAQVISKLLFALIGGIHTTSTELRHRKQLALQIIDFMEDHFGEPLQLSDLSARLYLSIEHMIRIFHEETGMTPYQYLKQLRMRRACGYLEESVMSVGDIAAAVGYQSISSFISQFKACYGMTPKTYRRSLLERSPVEQTPHVQEVDHDDDNERAVYENVSAQRG